MKILHILLITVISFTLKPSYEEMVEKYQIKEIHYCAYHNKIDCIQSIIKQDKRNINCPDKFGNTALHYAAHYNRKSVVKLLIDNNVDVDVTNNAGETPLLLAARQGNKAVIMMLCENHADIDRKSKYGQTPLNIADEDDKEIIINVNVLSTLTVK